MRGGRNANLEHISSTPKFLQQIKANLDAQNKATQRKDFEQFLTQTVDDDHERKKMMDQYIESFEDSQATMQSIKQSILEPGSAEDHLRRAGFKVDDYDNKDDAYGNAGVTASKVIELGTEDKKPKFVARKKVIETNATEKDAAKEVGSKDKMGLKKRSPERDNHKKPEKMKKKAANTNCLSFED